MPAIVDKDKGGDINMQLVLWSLASVFAICNRLEAPSYART